MIILDILSYFATFPARSAVDVLFTRGESKFPEYDILRNALRSNPTDPILPEVEGFVFGQSLDKVLPALDRISGTYLFVDFGECSAHRDFTNSINDTFAVAVTIASKIADFSDLAETAIITDRTLSLMSRMTGQLIADSEERYDIFRSRMVNYTIAPFTSPELKSIGWTISFQLAGFDSLQVSERNR